MPANKSRKRQTISEAKPIIMIIAVIMRIQYNGMHNNWMWNFRIGGGQPQQCNNTTIGATQVFITLSR